jgi:hypothetical protein
MAQIHSVDWWHEQFAARGGFTKAELEAEGVVFAVPGAIDEARSANLAYAGNLRLAASGSTKFVFDQLFTPPDSAFYNADADVPQKWAIMLKTDRYIFVRHWGAPLGSEEFYFTGLGFKSLRDPISDPVLQSFIGSQSLESATDQQAVDLAPYGWTPQTSIYGSREAAGNVYTATSGVTVAVRTVPARCQGIIDSYALAVSNAQRLYAALGGSQLVSPGSNVTKDQYITNIKIEANWAMAQLRSTGDYAICSDPYPEVAGQTRVTEAPELTPGVIAPRVPVESPVNSQLAPGVAPPNPAPIGTGNDLATQPAPKPTNTPGQLTSGGGSDAGASGIAPWLAKWGPWLLVGALVLVVVWPRRKGAS